MSVNTHSATFTSLSIDLLAKKYPDTSFVHIYPGLVKTQQLTNWIKTPWIKFLADWVIVPMVTPFTVGIEEAGARGLFYLTSARYPSLNGKKDNDKIDGVKLVEGLQVAKGEGAYMLGKSGEEGEGKIMKTYRENGMRERVWGHSLEVFEGVMKKTK